MEGFYKTLQRPDGKGLCCNLTICRPTSGRLSMDTMINGTWISVLQTKTIRQSDGGYHDCAPYNFKGPQKSCTA